VTDLRATAKATVQASVSPSSATAGQEILVRLTVTTTRNATADVTLRVVKPDGTQGYTASFPGQSFTANTARVFEDTLTVETADAVGTYSIGAQVLRSGSTSTLFDGSGLTTFAVTGAGGTAGVNLVPVALNLSPAAPKPGDAVTFSAQVKNAGDTDMVSAPLGILFTINGTSVVWYSTSPATTIRAGETVTLAARGGPSGTGTWTAGAVGTYTLDAAVDDQGKIVESSDSDNKMSRTFTVSSTPAETTPPSVPTGLTSSNRASTSFTLSWSPSTDNVGVTGYEVFRNGTSVGTTATTSFSVTGLTASTTYSMTVRARDAAGNWSSQSAALSVTTSTGSSTPTPSGFPTRTSVGPAVEPTIAWSGGCYITQSNLVIEDRIINCDSDGLRIARGTTGVVIRNSVINGGIGTGFTPGDPESEDSNYPIVFTVESSRIIQQSTLNFDRGVCCSHFVVRNSLIQGSHSGLWGFNKSTLENNYITTDGTDTHQSGLRMLKNSTLRGNTVVCKPVTPGYDGGCSAAAVFYREFGVPENLTIERNYFRRDPVGGPYFATRFIDCQNTNDCVNIKFTGNMFDLGWGTDGSEFPNDSGDVWSDNWWVDGQPALSGQSR
jgi:hypothetical protein